MAKTTQPSAGERDPLLPSSVSPPPYLDAHPADSYAVFLVPVRIRRRRLRRGCSSRCLGLAPLHRPLPPRAGRVLPLARRPRRQRGPPSPRARLRRGAPRRGGQHISAALKVRVRNPDLFGLDYSRLAVDIGYRGAKLGRVTSGGGHVRARAVSYIDADLHLNGIRVVEDAFYLLEDLARGSVPFDTVVEVEGHLRFFFLSLPVKVGG
ncbi:hypothetical protein PR202_ga13105 [Eleusine coracana subsp. coracana]|uniref:Late embryogenesis abundant protein LEA-2 subgroup domain-containing protein n=1 Tax=Eleusine coracana subsp. coracana TaxID=191504 RepID=A0AAV5CDG5_ELECO|nr:hypothetical protein PR202_ga13105 [Eleusine coracana subsp. coracana]